MAEKEQVRLGNLFVARTCEACRICADNGGGFIIENPKPWEGYECIWLLDEVLKLQQHTGAQFVDFDQCRFAGEIQKPTRVLYHRCRGDMLDKVCNHEKRRWIDAHGKEYWAAHERAIQRKRSDGNWATKALGAWPGPLNKVFAMLIHSAGPRDSQESRQRTQ